MTAYTLKWIALITMIIDHIGAVFFPQLEIIRIIGRISFPIFAFLLAEGFARTRNRTNYLVRLVIFAVVAEVPFDLCFHGSFSYWLAQSVMVELAIAFIALIFLEKTKKTPAFFILVIAMAFVAELLYSSYGSYGVLLVVAFYMFRKYRGADIIAFVALTYLFYGFTNWGFSIENFYYSILTLNSIQLYACLAALPLVFYSGKKGDASMKWFFYAIYPLHLALFYVVDRFLIPLF
ncbi:MAG: TraX family protein [Clostridia bacterium]